jgi:hypothetical protein
MMKLGKRWRTHMKRKQQTVTIPLHDYSPALQGALSWLGDRHLLAEPVARLNEERTPYFAEQRRWHPVIVAGAMAKMAD